MTEIVMNWIGHSTYLSDKNHNGIKFIYLYLILGKNIIAQLVQYNLNDLSKFIIYISVAVELD